MLDQVATFLKLEEYVMIQRLSRDWWIRAGGLLGVALHRLRERAALRVSLRRTRKIVDIAKDMMQIDESQRLEVTRVFYPMRPVFEVDRIPHLRYTPVGGDGPIHMDFTFSDENAVRLYTADYEYDWRMGYGINFYLELGIIMCDNPLGLLKRMPSVPFDTYTIPSVLPRASCSTNGTLGGRLQLRLSDSEDEGIEHNLLWLMGVPEPDTDDDEGNEEEEDDEEKDYEEDEEEMEQERKREIEIQHAYLDIVQWKNLLPKKLQPSYVRLVVFRRRQDVFRRLVTAMYSAAGGGYVKVLYGCEDSSLALYRCIVVLEQGEQLLIAIERIYAVLIGHDIRGNLETAVLDAMRDIIILYSETSAGVDLALDKRIMALQVKLGQLVRKNHVKAELFARGIRWNASASVVALYVESQGIAQWRGEPLTFERVVQVMEDDHILRTLTDYTSRFDTAYERRESLIQEYEEDELMSRCERSYNAFIRDHGHPYESCTNMEDIEPLEAMDKKCKLEAMRACPPSNERVVDLLSRFLSGSAHLL